MTQDKMGQMLKQYYEIVSNCCSDILTQEEDYIDIICHNFLEPPIVGKITKSKLRWRGATDIVHSAETGKFIGIQQRGYVIGIDGNKTKANEY